MRRLLPNRRRTETITVNSPPNGKAHVSIGYFPDGKIGEIFINHGSKVGSDAAVNASDAAVAVSIALQHGAPLDLLRNGMKRNADGTPQGVLAAVLDEVAKPECHQGK